MITTLRLRDAARGRVRAARDGDDRGFMLVYVLMIITIVTVLVASVLTVVSNAIVPSVQSAYDQAAQAAAQGGLQAFVAYLDRTCPVANSSVADCTLTQNLTGDVSIPIPNGDGSYHASYTWQAVKDPSSRYFRVRATGTVKQGGVTATRAVIGDVVGGSTLDLLDYGMVTGFESQSSSTVLRDWPSRTIALDNAVIHASGVPIKNHQIKWSGTSPGSAAGKVAICNATFDENGGRSNNLPPKAPNPYVDWTESGLGGNNYTHFGPCQTSWGTQTELLAPVNANNGVGGYYSNDAMLLSNSYPGGTGPLFDQPVSTGWQYTSADTGLCGVAPGQSYRSFTLTGNQCGNYPVDVGGAPSPASTYPDVQYGQGPQIPTATPVLPSDSCEYNGPTRILFQGDTAVVTSPQTTAAWATNKIAAGNPGQCYPNAGAQGMLFQTVSLTTPSVIHIVTADNDGTVPSVTPAQAHGSSGWPVTGQRAGDTAATSNSVFYDTTGTAGTTTSAPTYAVTAADGNYTPVTADNPSTKSDGAWTLKWTTDTATTTCNATSPAVTDLAFATCYIPKGTYGDSYSWLRAQIEAAVAANPSSYTTTAALQGLVDSFTKQGNSTDAASSAPTYADYRSHKWAVTAAAGDAGTCAQSTGVAGTSTDTPITAAPTSDSFFDSVAGKATATPSTDTSCVKAIVTLQVGTCSQDLTSGSCATTPYVWGDGTAKTGGGNSVAQFSVVFTVKKTTTTTVTTPARSSFPAMNDVTQYQLGTAGTFGASGPGDLYVEGDTTNTMALVAQDDLVVTGSTGATNPTTNTLELVGRNDVRVYHPVACTNATNESATQFATDIADTDPGFCPNDITGLYTQPLTDGTWPYQQYANLRPDLHDLTIRGAVFALGNSDAHITCPQPPSNDGVCGGEFDVDNYDRGAGLGHVTEVGTLAMSHHAPVGEEYELADRGGQTSRPYSGYQLAQQYQNVKAIIALVPEVSDVLPTPSRTSRGWHILSVSTASN